ARSLCARRAFTLTASNYGITFEGLRDAFPLQTFSVLPIDQGSVQPGWAMVNPGRSVVVSVPKTTIPDNIAFHCFSAVFKSLRTLHMHVDIDIDLEQDQNKKAGFFLGQIGRFLLSHRRGYISLSTIEVTVRLGFHNFVSRRVSAVPAD